MSQRFVLDENVAWEAQTMRDDEGNESVAAADLVSGILERCHGIVFCTWLYARFSRLADKLQISGIAQGPSVFGLAASAMIFIGKCEIVPAPAAVPGEEVLKDDDRPLLRLVVSAKAHLVTRDNPLRDELRKSGIPAREAINVFDVPEALAFLDRAAP